MCVQVGSAPGSAAGAPASPGGDRSSGGGEAVAAASAPVAAPSSAEDGRASISKNIAGLQLGMRRPPQLFLCFHEVSAHLHVMQPDWHASTWHKLLCLWMRADMQILQLRWGARLPPVVVVCASAAGSTPSSSISLSPAGTTHNSCQVSLVSNPGQSTAQGLAKSPSDRFPLRQQMCHRPVLLPWPNVKHASGTWLRKGASIVWRRQLRRQCSWPAICGIALPACRGAACMHNRCFEVSTCIVQLQDSGSCSGCSAAHHNPGTQALGMFLTQTYKQQENTFRCKVFQPVSAADGGEGASSPAAASPATSPPRAPPGTM